MLPDEEKQLIEERLQFLLENSWRCDSDKSKNQITKAFAFAANAHKENRRLSGEPYILHPLEVAIIVATEIELGPKSIIAALLHDVVEDTDYTVNDINNLFGEKIASLVDGLTKISKAFNNQPAIDTDEEALTEYPQHVEIQHSRQAEDFRKLLLTLSDDVRVILIKLADRLHNMRTLDSLPPNKQLKICGETLFLYAPLAHRFGLYRIKTELEDLSLKFRLPHVYSAIKKKMAFDERRNTHLINIFVARITDTLMELSYEFEIAGRQKSVYSTWRKMAIKRVTFEEVYDFLAVRIIFKPKPDQPESVQCWNIFGIISNFYTPREDRIRNWVTKPKANGYEALHGTFMGPGGKWVEVQIRSQRMQEIAERGYAAHFKYKGLKNEGNSELENWLTKVKEVLEDHKDNALEFLDDFKLGLFASEIIVFTPKGHIKALPKYATVLDFAFEVHTDLGKKCIGAKVNHKMVPRSYVLQNGDQVEVLTSQNQRPEPDWIDIAITAKAKNAIRLMFKNERNDFIESGKKTLDAISLENGIPITPVLMRKLLEILKHNNKNDLYYNIGKGTFDKATIAKILKRPPTNTWIRYWQIQLFGKNEQHADTETIETESAQEPEENKQLLNAKKKLIVNDKVYDPNLIRIGKCCNPIPGDDVIGYKSPDNYYVIHKTSCANAIALSAKYGDLVVKAQWTRLRRESFLARIKLSGIDRIGIVNNITDLISKELDVNMRAIHFDSRDDMFTGSIDLYVHDTKHLQTMIDNMKKVKGVKKVSRVEEIEE